MIENTTLTRILKEQIVGIVRLDGPSDFHQIVESLVSGGVSCIEIAMTTPGALGAIEGTTASVPGILMGAGTVLDATTARQAILAGAEFLVTPTVELEVIETARRYGKVVISGAMTPTEILAAWEAGADIVKVFPANVLGPSYLQAVHGPLPQIPLAPTGGVTAETAGEFIRAGAVAVCAGGWLIDKKAITDGCYEVLTARARELVDVVSTARGSLISGGGLPPTIPGHLIQDRGG